LIFYFSQGIKISKRVEQILFYEELNNRISKSSNIKSISRNKVEEFFLELSRAICIFAVVMDVLANNWSFATWTEFWWEDFRFSAVSSRRNC
jgi:hypothetical protein